MNVPNKITICRIALSVLLLIIMIFPLDKVGITFPVFKLGSTLLVSSKNILCGVIFMTASLTDFLDGHLARKYNMVTDMGKVLDAIADKILVNGVLIILALNTIPVIIPVIIVSRDIIVDSIKMVAGRKSGAVGASMAGKIKTACMLTGITLLFFEDLPFSLLGISHVSLVIIVIATILSVISGVQYYVKNKKYLTDNM